MDTRLMQQIKDILKEFPQYWNGEELQRPIVIDDLKNYDALLISALLKNQKIRENYSIKAGDVVIFKVQEFIDILRYKDYWADSYTKYSNTIGLSSEGKYLQYNTDVVLDFPYKDCILEGGMTKEDTGKEEFFYNEVIARDEIDTLLAPKALVNVKKYDVDGEHTVDSFSDEDNLIIKGNNLLALHSLKERYAGKVKCIYIDPPYNTGNDSFKYNDRFNHSTWLTFMRNRLEIAKELLSEKGLIFVQCDDNQQAYLKVLLDNIFAKENFMSNIVIKMSEASGVKMSHANKRLPKLKEYILSYKKNSNSEINTLKVKKKHWDSEYNSILVGIGEDEFQELDKIINKDIRDEDDFSFLNNCMGKLEFQGLPDYFKANKIPKNEQESFKWNNSYRIFRTAATSEKFTEQVKNFVKENEIRSSIFYYVTPQNRLYLLKNISNNENKKPRIQILLAKNYLETNPGDFWNDIKTTGLDNEGIVSFKNAKKPEEIIKRIITIATNENDIVLDFFMGSATTQAVAMKMNRRFIGIEQMDYINTVSVPRLQKVIEGEQGGISKDVNWQGGDSFIYAELMELNQLYMNKIDQASTKEELSNLWDELDNNADLNFQLDKEKLVNELLKEHDEKEGSVTFNDLTFNEQKEIFKKALDKNQLYVPYSEIEDKNVIISDDDKAFNHSFYNNEEK
ncbi:site-specific DNA-methyltransferase [Enterococcus faecalis]|uniref:site-specific DNA-methyltransferase n=3 Tax=Enterococcus faecalis TaxID=1351 RepID=UPI0022EFF620|nr:site-specific DNA-methyltransferase [Enterococcus faecalis]MCV5984079.1 site-specific DNA-methyltransferase [Enterococcus faecalis]